MLAGQLAPSSIKKYTQDWRAYQAWAGSPAAALDPATLARYRAYLANDTQRAPASINRILAACKRLVKAAAEQGYVPAALSAEFALIGGVKAKALRGRGRAHARTRISPAEMRRLCDAPDPDTLPGRRDRALLALLASSGVRIAEAVSVQPGDVQARGGGFVVRVLGKGQAEPRDAPLSREAAARIAAWLAARPCESAHVFTAFGGRGRAALPRRLSTVAAWRIVTHYAAVCGLPTVKPHDLRRFCGTQIVATTGDIRKAQKALGHANITTTAKFYVLDDLTVGLTDELY